MRAYTTSLIGIAMFFVLHGWTEQAALPTVFRGVQLDSDELRRLYGGDVVVKTLESDADSDW